MQNNDQSIWAISVNPILSYFISFNVDAVEQAGHAALQERDPDCVSQVFLFEKDGEGVWSFALALSPEPELRIDGGGCRAGVSAAFSAKLAMFRSPAKKVPFSPSHLFSDLFNIL